MSDHLNPPPPPPDYFDEELEVVLAHIATAVRELAARDVDLVRRFLRGQSVFQITKAEVIELVAIDHDDDG